MIDPLTARCRRRGSATGRRGMWPGPLLGSVLLVVLALLPRASSARERMAVMIIAGGDDALSDNLTEVAISTLAEAGEADLIGVRELRGRVGAALQGQTWDRCVADPVCLAGVLTAADAGRSLVGIVRRDADAFALSLSLDATKAPATPLAFSRLVPLDVPALIEAVKNGVTTLLAQGGPVATGGSAAPAHLAPSAAATAAPPAAPLSPAITASGPPPVSLALTAKSPSRSSTPRYVGYAATVLTGVALSGAAITGVLANAKPTGATRAEEQADLDRRHQYATDTNRLLVLGGVLALAAAVAFIWSARGSSGRH